MAGEAIGYVAVLIATLFFGSNFVPVKRYETHDGMYYQWVMCAAIFMTGLALQFFLFALPLAGDGFWTKNGTWHVSTINGSTVSSGRPDAYTVEFIPLAAFGGALWATGNTLSVPVINLIGLSLGLLIWGSSNMLMGWATGMFGLFVGYEHRDTLATPVENYVGVALAVLALALYTQIKTGDDAPKPKTVVDPAAAAPNPMLGGGPSADAMVSPLRAEEGGAYGAPAEAQQAPEGGGGGVNRMLGVLMAVVAGILFGNNFTPPNYLMDNKLGPKEPLDYVFSHFVGIFATSTFWFVCYCSYMRGKPRINPSITLPAMLSGLMWAIAQTCWFVANDKLSVSVSFPTVTSGPGIVSALWGVFVFGEIKGTRNYAVLCIAIAMALAGCVLIGLSKGA